MKQLIFILSALLSLSLFSQEKLSKFDIRIGTGSSFGGSGDFIFKTFENELNYRINNYFTMSPSFGFAKSDYGVYNLGSYLHGDMNFFVSPFKNNKFNDFRIGLGASFLEYSYSYEYSRTTLSNGEEYSRYWFVTEKDFGLNLIFENTVRITPRLLVGLKAFTQMYMNNINSGVLVKVGYTL